MGRGIDFKGVNVVVNYDFPPTAVSYIHRIGEPHVHTLLLTLLLKEREVVNDKLGRPFNGKSGIV